MAKYLNPKADLTFKKVFGEHKDLVTSFLNAMLPIDKDAPIEAIEYLSPEMVPENPARKYSIVDVRCTDQLGRQFIVEMQMIWSPEFKSRVLFNASKAYVRQLDQGENYHLLQPVYSLNLVNEIFEPDIEGYYHHYSMVHLEHTDKVIEGLHLVFIELPKFKPQTFNEKKMQVLWLRYLTEIDEQTTEIPAELLEEPQVKKAIDVLEVSAFTRAELEGYDKFWDMVSVEKTIFSSAERRGLERGLSEGMAKGLAKGMAEGMAKGMEKGMAEGLAKGMEKGMAEGLAKGEAKGRAEGILDTARKMLEAGIDKSTIAQITGLDPDLID